MIRNRGPVCSAVGAAVLGAEPAAFPSPLPPASCGAGPQPASSSLDLLRPFVLRTAGSVFGPVNFFSPLLSYSLNCYLTKAPSACPQGTQAGPYPEQCRPLLSVLPLFVGGGAGVWGTFLLGVAFRHLTCGFYLLFLSSQVALRDSKTSPRPASARVSWCLETSSIKTPFPGWISVLSSFVSLFIFYVLSYLLSKTMGCFSGRLMTSASDQKLFCEVCSVFGYSFDEFVGEKGVSPSYSSAILAPPPPFCR